MQCCDVFVAGGGSAGPSAAISAARAGARAARARAGLRAAISAARLGARTLLVHRGGSLGGMCSAALVHSICGIYRLPETAEECGTHRGGAPGESAREVAGDFANPGL